MIYVSRYSNKELQTGKYTAVRISVGTPRWSLGYKLDDAIHELMPYKSLKIEDKEQSRQAYYSHLASVGVDKIAARLKALEAKGKPVVLLCYEDIRKSDNWCHRTFFAEWWFEQTGVKIEELPEPKVEKAARKETQQLSLF